MAEFRERQREPGTGLIASPLVNAICLERENVMATTQTTQQGKTLDKRETASLIGSDKVEGTPVFRSNGDRVGRNQAPGSPIL